MSTLSLDDREIEMIVLALRFWRAQRRSGETRRTDSSFVSPDDVDFLLAKMQSGSLRMRPVESARLSGPADALSR
jgi:hypothetical protein